MGSELDEASLSVDSGRTKAPVGSCCFPAEGNGRLQFTDLGLGKRGVSQTSCCMHVHFRCFCVYFVPLSFKRHENLLSSRMPQVHTSHVFFLNETNSSHEDKQKPLGLNVTPPHEVEWTTGSPCSATKDRRVEGLPRPRRGRATRRPLNRPSRDY